MTEPKTLEDAINRIEMLQDDLSELQDALKEVRQWKTEASVYISIPGNPDSLVAQFKDAEEALMCLPALSRILQRSLYLVSTTSLGLVNPIPERCVHINYGFMFQPSI